MYVDVHAHLTFEKLLSDIDNIVIACRENGIASIIVNGLDPSSNREALKLAQRFPIIKPALGIYPVYATNQQNLPFEIPKFDLDDEIEFIKSEAQKNNLVAIGECGLDGYWVSEDTFPAQEKVFLQFIEIAVENNLPLIVHSRKLEKRTIDILANYKITKVCFHCFGGKPKDALKAAENFGFSFSIPANAETNDSFKKMLLILPKEKILTETDSPYLSPKKGQLNTPLSVIGTVNLFAKLRNIEIEEAITIIWNNYLSLFGDK